jgi:hypothetical protein
MSQSEPVDVNAGVGAVQPESKKDHPAEVALFGFIAGVIDVLVVPAIFVTTIQNFWRHAQFNVLTVGLATLVVPIILLAFRKTRRFAECMILGGAVMAFAEAAIWMTFKILLDS